MSKIQSTTTAHNNSSHEIATTLNEQSLGPNLQSRLEALEAAMGVRLNVAKRQGRHSLSNTASSSPMQISPTSSASTTISTVTTSLSVSSRHNIPARTGQGVQRSSSSCDVENRPGPIKRLKPSFPIEHSSASTAAAIATIKKYTPPVRRPITTITTPIRSIQTKQSNLTKQRSSPLESSSNRSTRSSNTSTNNANYRTPIGSSPKLAHASSTKQRAAHSSTSSRSSPPPQLQLVQPPAPPPPPPRPTTFPRTNRSSIFGEQFSDDMLRTNLLWINLNELDDEGRTEVLIQFGSIENFLREQQLFSAKRQRQLRLAARHKTVINRSRLHLLLPKTDRLELL